MTFNKLLLGISLISCLSISPALAGKDPRPSSADNRVKIVTYHENDVYQIRGHYGYSTVIEFADKERIQTISLGDTQAWQVMKPGQPNIMFIKPLEEDAETNMTVITDKRIYSFEVTANHAHSHRSSDLTFRLKFHYADEAAKELAFIGSVSSAHFNPLDNVSASDLNFDYSYAGSKRLRPVRAFDDGVFTYFQFEDFEVMPAVFSVDEHGNERLVNFNLQGQYLVVSGIGSQFTLRDGDTATCIWNDAYPEIEPASYTPEPIAELEKVKNIDMAFVPIPASKPDIDGAQAEDEDKPSILAQLISNFESPKSASLND